MFPFPVFLAGRLIVYVLAPPAAEGTLDGATASLSTALSNDTKVEVVVVKELPKEGISGTAQAIATMTWSEDGRKVVVRLRKADDVTTLERELSFDPRDSPRERGRTAGFAIASMLSYDHETPQDTKPKVAPREPESPAKTLVAPVLPPPVAQVRPMRFALDAALSGGVGFGGVAGGIGGGIGARLKLGGPLWLSVAIRVRRSEISEVKATSTFSQGAVGAYLGDFVGASKRVSLGVRADVAFEWQYLSHFSGDEPGAVGEGRILPVFALSAEGGFRVGDSVELWLGLGPQIASGKTDLYLRSRQVTQVPLFRGALDLGFRAYF